MRPVSPWQSRQDRDRGASLHENRDPNEARYVKRGTPSRAMCTRYTSALWWAHHRETRIHDNNVMSPESCIRDHRNVLRDRGCKSFVTDACAPTRWRDGGELVRHEVGAVCGTAPSHERESSPLLDRSITRANVESSAGGSLTRAHSADRDRDRDLPRESGQPFFARSTAALIAAMPPRIRSSFVA